MGPEDEGLAGAHRLILGEQEAVFFLGPFHALVRRLVLEPDLETLGRNVARLVQVAESVRLDLRLQRFLDIIHA